MTMGHGQPQRAHGRHALEYRARQDPRPDGWTKRPREQPQTALRSTQRPYTWRGPAREHSLRCEARTKKWPKGDSPWERARPAHPRASPLERAAVWLIQQATNSGAPEVRGGTQWGRSASRQLTRRSRPPGAVGRSYTPSSRHAEGAIAPNQSGRLQGWAVPFLTGAPRTELQDLALPPVRWSWTDANHGAPGCTPPCGACPCPCSPCNTRWESRGAWRDRIPGPCRASTSPQRGARGWLCGGGSEEALGWRPAGSLSWRPAGALSWRLEVPQRRGPVLPPPWRPGRPPDGSPC